jgi:hypothetical protein
MTEGTVECLSLNLYEHCGCGNHTGYPVLTLSWHCP